MKNYTYIQATNLAVLLAKSQRKDEDIIVVGAEGYANHAPSDVICLNGDLTEYLDENPNKPKILVLVRVFEHLDMTLQYWYKKFIDSNVRKIVAVTPDMEHTLRNIDFDDYYHIFRSEFEIFNEWKHNDLNDWFYNAHKWFVSKTTLKSLPSMRNIIEDFINVNGFQHIISYHEIVPPPDDKVGYHNLPESVILQSMKSFIETDVANFEYEPGHLDFLQDHSYRYIRFRNVLCKDKLIRFPWYVLKHYLDENPNTYVVFEEYNIYAELLEASLPVTSERYQDSMNRTYRNKCISIVNKKILDRILKHEDLIDYVDVKFI